MTWRDPAYLLDMLLAARHAREFAAGLDRAAFEASSLHQHAIAQALSNLGEAARKVSQGTRDAHPEIPWPQIVAYVTASRTTTSGSTSRASGTSSRTIWTR